MNSPTFRWNMLKVEATGATLHDDYNMNVAALNMSCTYAVTCGWQAVAFIHKFTCCVVKADRSFIKLCGVPSGRVRPLTAGEFQENCLLGGRGLYDCLQKHNLSFLLFQGQKYSPENKTNRNLCGSLCLGVMNSWCRKHTVCTFLCCAQVEICRG